MGGIAGFISEHKKADIQIIKRMLSLIRHRGSDDCNIFIDNNIATGSKGLCEADSDNNSQYASVKNHNLTVSFSGRIFNYPELKSELEKKGYRFITLDSEELIIYLYSEYGKDCVNKLNGQFAFSIWDKTKQELFLTRDRIGILPLFYYLSSDLFVFGSEVKALFGHPDVKPEFCVNSLSEVFTFWATVSPNTVFRGIKECPPGHYMLIKNGKAKIIKYWDLKFSEPGNYFRGSFDDAVSEFDTVFSDSVKLRLRTDIEIGAYLSGGIDSATITQYIKSARPGNLQTFSVGFSEKEFDESEYQKIVSNYLQTRHTGYNITSFEIAENFPRAIWHCETPLLRTSPVPMFKLSQRVKEHNINIVLSGEGADELLAGYNIFKENKIRRFWAKDKNSKIRPLLLSRLYPYIKALNNANPNALKLFFGYKLEETDSPVYSHLLRWNNTSSIKNHFNSEIKEKIKLTDPYQSVMNMLGSEMNFFDPLSKAQYIEMKIFLSGYLLSSQGDRMSMANGVEARFPFLDHRVIEFSNTLPPDYKLRGLNEKVLLKRMMKGKLPEEIINRPKQPYRAPVLNSFLGKQSPEYINEILSPEFLKESNIFNPDSVVRLLLKMNSGKAYSEIDNMALTAIISTQLLYYMFIKNFNNQYSDSFMNISLNKA